MQLNIFPGEGFTVLKDINLKCDYCGEYTFQETLIVDPLGIFLAVCYHCGGNIEGNLDKLGLQGDLNI